jgi:hypothetical protein
MRPVFAALGLAALLGAAPALAATGHTAWNDIAMDQEQCLELGREAFARLGFRPVIPEDRQTVFAWRGDDLLATRCIADRNLAVHFVYIHQRQDGAQIMDAIRAVYAGARAGATPGPAK